MLITIKALSFCYARQQVLKDIHATLQAGEVVALVGANGSGKSTLMRLLLGDLHPSGGEIVYDKSLHGSNALAFVPDKPPLYPDWTVSELLRRLARERGLASAAVNDVVMRCGLHNVVAKRCRELSHGYRQRVNLAQALLHRPSWLCMDEPMNGLDEAQRAVLRDMVVALAREGMTILLSLHDLLDVAKIADRVWYLHDGKLFDLPLSASQEWWAVFSDEAAAAAYSSGVQQGRVRGFSQDEFAELGTALWADKALEHVGRVYPVAALQARMAACQHS